MMKPIGEELGELRIISYNRHILSRITQFLTDWLHHFFEKFPETSRIS